MISSAPSWLVVARKHVDIDELLGEMQFCEAGQAWNCCLMQKSVLTKSRAKSHQVLVTEPITGGLIVGHSALSQTSPQESWNQLAVPSVSQPSFPCQPAINSYSCLEVASQFLMLFTFIYLPGFALLHF